MNSDGCSQVFNDLLRSLAAEHRREVHHLRAEISRLKFQHILGDDFDEGLDGEGTRHLAVSKTWSQARPSRESSPASLARQAASRSPSTEDAIAEAVNLATEGVTQPGDKSKMQQALARARQTILEEEATQNHGAQESAERPRTSMRHSMSSRSSGSLGTASGSNDAMVPTNSAESLPSVTRSATRRTTKGSNRSSWLSISSDLDAWTGPEPDQKVCARWKKVVVGILSFLPLDKAWGELIDMDEEVCDNDSDSNHSGAGPPGGRARRHSVFSLGSVGSSVMPRPQPKEQDFNGFVRSRSMLDVGKAWWTLNPGSKGRMMWDLIGAMFLLHDVIIIPMQVFEDTGEGWPPRYRRFLFVCELAACGFWSTDVLLSFITGYYTRNGYVEMSPRMIACCYLKSWFALDFSVTVLDWISVVMTVNESSDGGATSATSAAQHLRLGKIITRVTRLLRLLRFMKLNKSLVEHVHIINSEYILAVLTLMRLILILTIFGHYIACGWYGLTQITQYEYWNWLIVNDKHDLDSMGYLYMTSLHWSLTQFTPASMEVVPYNTLERAYNIVVILVAMVTFSSFVSSITNTMTHIRRINAERNKEEAAIRRFFSQCNISSELASRVWWVLQQKRLHVDSRLKVSDVPSLRLLPVHILNDVLAETHAPILQRHPLFCCIGSMDPEAMHELCCFALSERSVPLGEMLFGKGISVHEMFFVVRGCLQYHDLNDHEAPRVSVSEGMWACEAALWTSQAKLAGPFVAEIFGVDMITIAAGRLKDLVLEHPPSIHLVARYAAMFMRRFNRASIAYDPSNRLFNDRGVLKQMVHMVRLRTLGSATFTNMLF